mmetsp:Transcript_20003/g.29487  ORF Transcript_20003/g.29487 Transcript_20003/m.29487 type:complete len:206 (-) Transcript_20003:8-625(-)
MAKLISLMHWRITPANGHWGFRAVTGVAVQPPNKGVLPENVVLLFNLAPYPIFSRNSTHTSPTYGEVDQTLKPLVHMDQMLLHNHINFHHRCLCMQQYQHTLLFSALWIIHQHGLQTPIKIRLLSSKLSLHLEHLPMLPLSTQSAISTTRFLLSLWAFTTCWLGCAERQSKQTINYHVLFFSSSPTTSRHDSASILTIIITHRFR